MIDNQDKANNGVLGRLVDDAGELKEPSHCIIQYGGRVRLPDKLMEILNKEFAPEVMWWQPDGECFAFDSETVQKKILDVWFRGTKLSSFIRSLNRWGFRRVFYHALPEAALAFHHASFRKTSSPDMLKSMKMSKSGKASAAKTEQPVAASSLSKPLIQTGMESPVLNTPNRLSQLSQVGTPAAASLSVLPQLPLSNISARAPVEIGGSSDQQEALLKLLSEHRSRDLLTLASARRPSYPPTASAAVNSLQIALAAQREQQQQRAREEEQQKQNLLLLARAEQELRAQQGQALHQQRNEAALRLALAALKNRQNQSIL